MQAEQSILDRIQRGNLKWFGRLLKMEDSRWAKTYSGHRTVGGEEEDRDNHGRTK